MHHQESTDWSTTYVGNVCINRFIGIDTGNLFGGLKRIARDRSANANTDLIEHAQKFGYLYEKEYDFLMETRHKRKSPTSSWHGKRRSIAASSTR